jgi:hypothetical protein
MAGALPGRAIRATEHTFGLSDLQFKIGRTGAPGHRGGPIRRRCGVRKRGHSLIPAALLYLSKICSTSCRTGIPRDFPPFSEKRRANWVPSCSRLFMVRRATAPTPSAAKMRTTKMVWSLGLPCSRCRRTGEAPRTETRTQLVFRLINCFAPISAPLKALIAQLDLKLCYSIADAVADTGTATNGARSLHDGSRRERELCRSCRSRRPKNRISATEL